MEEGIKPVKSRELKRDERPLLLSLLCIFSWIFFGVLTLFFLAGIFEAGWIMKVTNQYLSATAFTTAEIRIFMVSGLALHLIAGFGITGIWRLKKSGYLILSVSCLIIVLYQLFNPAYTVITVLLYILLPILFGVFIRKYH
ncbi:MAG TPA: hypothetical protein PKN44_02635 [Bacteroidales bacterium]|nr:hypothetical protein [Bacteroidales bacterium]HPS50891.1 hypothetical protein [Bacteroidales bacterium]